MIHYQNSMEECIRHLLKRFQLDQYTDMFLSNGHDDVGVIRGINEVDLQMMGLTCHKEIYEILDLLSQLNEAFTMYMSVHEVQYTRPSTEHVLSYIADKFERKGMFPSAEECVPVVLEKLEKEAILLPARNYHLYVNKDGQCSSRREYKMLIARYSQELFLPDQSVAGALKLIHDSSVDGLPPPKPPKPKVIPLYDQSTGKLVWLNSEDDPNYENINYIYEFLNNLVPEDSEAKNSAPDQLNLLRGTDNQNQLIAPPIHEDMRKSDVDSSQSQNSSPGPTRPIKKKQTFFKRFKNNLFGKSNSSLDSYLASSSNRSSECSNSKISFFKNKSKKDKHRYDRQRSNSAPEPSRNVNLQQIPELRNGNQNNENHGNDNHVNSHHGNLNPTYARPYQHNQRDMSTNFWPECRYYHIAGIRPTSQSPVTMATTQSPVTTATTQSPAALIPTQSAVRSTKSDTFSNASISSSGSVSGDSAYSSKPSLNAIKSSHRPVLYGPLTVNQNCNYDNCNHGNQHPLSRVRRCPCGSCRSEDSR